MSKPLRQKVILDLLERGPVASQEELQRALSRRGLRVGQATLSRDIHGGYPDFTWDVGVIAFRDAGGRAIAPHWNTFSLSRHPQCSCGNG